MFEDGFAGFLPEQVAQVPGGHGKLRSATNVQLAI
jgi:hypothetical protein